MKIFRLIAATIAVVAVEIFVALAFILIPLLIFGGDLSTILPSIFFYLYWVAIASGVIVIVLGIPSYLILEKKDHVSISNLAMIGFMIPIVIFIVLSAIYSVGSGFSSGQNFYGTYRDIIVNGERTLWGWISFGEDALKFGIHGLIGAIVFGKAMFWMKKSAHAA
ncbi:MAG: hypothetical protein DHS20C11_28470 [Lysobacteraceae bacterium]|nr:MAG: hypothetical protein DHS20C11_28470 [Xanthomonadaceae bacterium]